MPHPGAPGELAFDQPNEVRVWRVGYRPDPWCWVGWEWATDGRFGGRWDDADGNFRTVYVGATLLACLVELLADFRLDAVLAADLDDIDVDPRDASHFPTAKAGLVPRNWLDVRAAGTGQLSGRFCQITATESIATLHPIFAGRALRLGLRDFDAAAIKDSRSRPLTQAVATFLYANPTIDGVQFSSRHGDDLRMWAIFERPGDSPVTPRVNIPRVVPLTHTQPDLQAAMSLLGLDWAVDT